MVLVKLYPESIYRCAREMSLGESGVLRSRFNCSILDSATGSSSIRIKEFASFQNTQNWNPMLCLCIHLCIFPLLKTSTLFSGGTRSSHGEDVCAACADGLRSLSGNGSLPVKPMGCESLRVSYHSGCITSPKNISCGERVCVRASVCVCVCG